MDTMKNIFRNLKELYWKYDKPVHLALVMALAALYFLDVNQYMYRVLIMIGLYAILALSLNHTWADRHAVHGTCCILFHRRLCIGHHGHPVRHGLF